MTDELGRRVEPFDEGWRFYAGEAPEAHLHEYDDSGWRELCLPHDWSIEGPFAESNPSGGSGGFAPGGVGWYRKSLVVPAVDRGRRVSVRFDGVYHNSDVWINGHHLGRRPYGYVSFEYDLTPYLAFGSTNVLSVRVDNTDLPNCRWYTGSGIYRHVWLTVVDPVHVALWGTYVTTPRVDEESASVQLLTSVTNSSDETQLCVLETTLTDSEGRVVATATSEATIPPRQELDLAQTFTVEAPKLWSPDSPELYLADTRISVDGRLRDRYATTFGIRHIRFDSDEGFFLNGVNMKMKGVNYHHDGGCVGAAVPDGILRRRFNILKGLGCNAIRTCHNPPSPELLTLCDEMGFLVIDEAFDKWHSGSYGKIFDEWWERDLDSMIRRDRNHPSIVVWSVGNEVEDQGSDRQVTTLKMLTDYVRAHEPSRPVTCVFYPAYDLDQKARNEQMARMAPHVDILGCNYHEQWYDDYRTFIGDKAIIGTECFPFFRGRGDKMKSYEPINPWFDVVKNSYVAGGFIWPGYDYLGESVAWPVKGWPAGILDTCGFQKPLSYFFQSAWSDEPVVHIAVFDDTIKMPRQGLLWSAPKMASHWNFPHFRHEIVRLVTFTNCERVDLFINDEWMQTKYLSEFPDHMMTWYVPYEEGIIKAVGVTGGTEVCAHELKTAGEAVSLASLSDREFVRADGLDVFHVEVCVTDSEGVTVPDADQQLTFTVEGPGRLIGLDNGDLECVDDYKGVEHRPHLGRCLAIVQSSCEEGQIVLSISAPGLKGAQVVVASVACR